MAERQRNRGPWLHRLLTALFAGLFAVLWFWLLGFVLDDVGAIPGPSYQDLERERLNPSQLSEVSSLQSRIGDAERRVADGRARQELLRDSTSNSQTTMNQLLELQRSTLARNVTPSAEERQALVDSQQLFLANQRQYQTLNEQLVALNEQLRDLKRQLQSANDALDAARKPVLEEYDRRLRRHSLWIAALKLAVLVPLLVAGVVLFRKYRNGPYALIVYAFGGAVLLEVALVIHEYFPSRYFKYVLILTAIAIVLQALVYLIRMVTFPKKDWLLRQYREAYEAFLCPVCAYPIRRGPLKYMFWTRRSIAKIAPHLAAGDAGEEPYVCPMCATRLYEECRRCRAIRASLLPSCQRCGDVLADGI